MADKTKFTSVQITHEASKMLGIIAKSYNRSKSGQIGAMVKKEYEWLRKIKLVPSVEEQEAKAE